MTLVQKFIIDSVCYYFGITYEDLLNLDRSSAVKNARMVAIRLLYKCAESSYKEIGEILKRHHSSIMGGYSEIEKHNKLMVLVEHFKEEIMNREDYFVKQAAKHIEDSYNVKV